MIAFTTKPTLNQNPNTAIPLAAVLSFETNVATETVVTLSSDSHQFDLRFSAETIHHHAIVGMKPARAYQLRVTIQRDEKFVEYPLALSFTTPPLPEDLINFPPLLVETCLPDKMEPGLTLIFARRRVPGEPTALTREQRAFMMNFGLIIALDTVGDVVWYYESHARIADMIRLRNGNFLYITTEYDVTEIDILGNIVQQWYAKDRPQGAHPTAIPIDGQTIHHCIYELSNGNLMAFTAQAKEVENYYTSEWNPDAPRKTQMVMGDTIIEFTRNGDIVWRWNCFDHLDPFRIGYETLYTYWWVRGFPGHTDWTHGNSMWIDELENTILLCLRYQEAIIKIDRASGEIIWILGENLDWPDHLQGKVLRPIGDIQWPYHMHTPSITKDGTFLIFDNGVFGARPFRTPKLPRDTFGRAAEYRIDEANMTVKQIWASDHKGDPDNLISYAMGDADEMPNTGNVLISYGMSITPEQAHDIPATEYNRCSHQRCQARIREVTRSTPPETVFDVRLRIDKDEPNIGWVCFGAEKIGQLI